MIDFLIIMGTFFIIGILFFCWDVYKVKRLYTITWREAYSLVMWTFRKTIYKKEINKMHEKMKGKNNGN